MRWDGVGAHLDMEEISVGPALSCCKWASMASRCLACSSAYLDAAMLCFGGHVPYPEQRCYSHPVCQSKRPI